jgi:hypothetical protein
LEDFYEFKGLNLPPYKLCMTVYGDIYEYYTRVDKI